MWYDTTWAESVRLIFSQSGVPNRYDLMKCVFPYDSEFHDIVYSMPDQISFVCNINAYIFQSISVVVKSLVDVVACNCSTYCVNVACPYPSTPKP